jgi:hypothetical protein
MAKEDLIEMHGDVDEVLPDSRYRVSLDQGSDHLPPPRAARRWRAGAIGRAAPALKTHPTAHRLSSCLARFNCLD